MKIKLTTKSYLLCGSGEGAAMIDADVVFDVQGFPFIPGKRIKGVLRESAMEVMEICGISLYKEIDLLFGSRCRPGLLQLSNLYPEHYEASAQFVLAQKNENAEIKNLLSSARIKRHYTTERQQTALTSEGVAKKFSLRNYRVIKPGLTFVTVEDFDSSLSSKRLLALLQLSLINLKHIGTRRNRGFGIINMEMENGNPSVGELLKVLEETEEEDEETYGNVDQLKKEQSDNTHLNKNTGSSGILPFIIKTLSPVVIAKQRGEQNTVSSEDYFPATAIRGMLSQKLIKHLSQNQEAHKDALFNEIFLSGDIIIKDAFPFENNLEYKPIPLAYQAIKGGAKEKFYNILEKHPVDDDGKKQITRPADSWIAKDSRQYLKLEPAKSFYFHNVRYDNRLAGKSKEGGGIFYYESLNAGQTYKGHLYGDKTCLQNFRDKLGDSFKARIGRSKNTQYGEVKFCFEEFFQPQEKISLEKDFVYLTFTSPVIILNEDGFPEPSKSNLECYLSDFFPGVIEIVEMISNMSRVENYLGTWRCKMPAEPALAKGTTIKLRFLNFDANKDEIILKLNELIFTGIGERKNEGFGNVKPMQMPNEINVKPAPTILTDENDITPVIKDVLKASYQDELDKTLKLNAMKRAERYQYKLSNHLVGRLEEMVEKAKNVDDWEKQYMDHLESKQAGQRLKEVRLWDDLYKNFEKPVTTAADEDELKKTRDLIDKKTDAEPITAIDQFAKAKLYWSCFFKTLRKLNNQ